MFSEPVAAKAVKVLMRGAKPWGYFGLSQADAISSPSPFMLVSGSPAAQEQCVVATGKGVAAKPCIDAMWLAKVQRSSPAARQVSCSEQMDIAWALSPTRWLC